MKKSISVVLVLVFIFAFAVGPAACLKADNELREGINLESGSSKHVKLNITWWGSQVRHEYTQQLLDLYTLNHPNVTFVPVPSSWEGYFDKLSAQGAGNSMPDIIQMDYTYISTFTMNGLLTDLQPFVNDGTLDISQVDSSLIATGNVNGKLTGVPLSSVALAVIYNPEVFEDAGLDMPEPDWSWEDFISTMLEIKNNTGLYGTGKPISDLNIFAYWVRQHGEKLFALDGAQLGFEDDTLLIDFLNMQKELQDKNALPSPDEWAQFASKGKEAEPVVLGESGTTFDWSNFIVVTAHANPNLKLMIPPQMKDTNGLWIKPSMFFSIAESSKNKEEAARFIDWFLNNEEANEIINAERGIPASNKIRDALKEQGTEQQKEMFDYFDLAIQHSSKIDPPEPAGVAEVTKLLIDITNRVMYGEIDSASAAAEFREEANDILRRNAN